jgi:glycosyltransferase involved in cell wall biosynthesis
MNKQKISIVIPAYNEEKNIVLCLQSIKNQTYKGEVEIIVSDNNSNDNTASLARAQGATVVLEKKAGVIFARETGTRASTGNIIIQTDADTTYPPNWIETIMLAFERNPKAVAIVGSFKFVNAPWWGKYFTGLLFGITDLVHKMTKKLIYIPGCNTAFKKSAWHGYDIKLDQGGDEVALLRQLKKEGDIVFLRNNKVSTSARRLKKGILYNIFVTLLFYYVIDRFYRIITGKSVTSNPWRISNQSKPITQLIKE